MKVLNWLKHHWYVPLFAVGAVFAAVVSLILFRKPLPARKRVQQELKAIRKAQEVEAVLIKEGTEAAKEAVKEQHYETVKAIDKAAQEKAHRLRDNPVALSKHLERAAARLRDEA